MSGQWQLLETEQSGQKIHPLVRIAFKAHKQITNFIQTNGSGLTPEIWELFDLAYYINSLKRNNVKGLEKKLSRLTSDDFLEYPAVRYEIQVAGMLLGKGHTENLLKNTRRKRQIFLLLVKPTNVRSNVNIKNLGKTRLIM